MRNTGRETGAGQATPTNFEIDRIDHFFCGAGGRGRGVTCFFGGGGDPPVFFRNCRAGTRTFPGILSSRCDLFLQSSAIDPNFFCNCQLTTRCFFEKSGWDRTEHLGFGNGSRGWGLSPPYPHERGVPPPPMGRPRGGSITEDEHAGNLPSEGPVRRPSDTEQSEGGIADIIVM